MTSGRNGTKPRSPNVKRIQKLKLEDKIDRLKATIRSQKTLLELTQRQHSSEGAKVHSGPQFANVNELKRTNEQLRLENLALRSEIKRMKETLSFQLGYTLIHGFKSWNSFCRLPRQVLALWQEAQHRKKRPKNTPLSAVQSDLSSSTTLTLAARSTWIHPFVKCSPNSKSHPKVRKFIIGTPIKKVLASRTVISLTPQNYLFELSRCSKPIVYIYVNRQLAQSPWGNFFGFEDMQNFRRFMEVREYVIRHGGEVQTMVEDATAAPFLLCIQGVTKQ